MRPLLLMPALIMIATSCQSGSGTAEPWARVRCAALEVADAIAPVPPVTFAGDSSAALGNWRASAGPPVADRAGRSCARAPLDSVLVISWNTHLGHGDLRAFVSDLRAGRVIAGQRVEHFVLLVQEVFRTGDAVPARVAGAGCTRRIGGAGADIEDVADSLGLALFYAPSMRNGCGPADRQDRGNAILSTLPLSNLRAVELPLVRQRRVAVMAEVQGEDTRGRAWTLVLGSLHLENRGRGGPGAWAAARARQAAAFVEQLPDSVLLAVGGDLNTLNGPDEPAVRIISQAFAHTPEHQGKHTFASYFVMRSHLDYLFFRCYGRHRSTYWRADRRYGSDHYPIMGFVRVS